MPPLRPRIRHRQISQTKHAFERLDTLCNENKSVDGHPFVPTSVFDRLFTLELLGKVLAELLQSEPAVEGEDDANEVVQPKSVEEIYAQYRKILAILIMLRKEDFLFDFVEHGCTDKSLPLDKEKLDEIDPDGGLSKSTFVRKQYLFLTEPLVRGSEYQWSSEIVLPILREETLRSGRGGFGTVYKITLHEDYDKLAHEDDKNQSSHIYARKTLSPYQDACLLEQDFRLEVEAGQRLRQHRNPNIIPLLAHFKHGDKYNLIFPFCECNLQDFFGMPLPNANMDPEVDRLRLLEKIARLSSALATIHFCEDRENNGPQHFGYHRDLKPQNILKKDDCFMIADFGLMRFSQSDKEHTSVMSEYLPWDYGPGTYRAPECAQNGKKIGRRADIWALGCILAETVAYAVRGPEGVVEFGKRRTTKEKSGDSVFNNDYFHDGRRVKKEVHKYLDFLRHQKEPADEMISDFITLIERMLTRNPKHRPIALKVGEELYRILGKEAQRLSVKLELEEPRNDKRSATLGTHGLLSRAHSAIEDRTHIHFASPPGWPKFGRTDTGSSSIESANEVSEIAPQRHIIPKNSRVPRRGQSDDPLKLLDNMDTMFFIDDSCISIPTHWKKVRRSLSLFAAEGTKHDPDGVDLAFLNSEEEAHSLGSETAVMKAFDAVAAADPGAHVLSLRLGKILADYVRKYKSDRISTSPLNLIVVTSGELEKADFDELQNIIMHWAKILDDDSAPIHQLGIQFVLIGSSVEAKERFHNLDEIEYQRRDVRDIVDATRFDPDIASENDPVLCKIMCGGVVKAWDKRQYLNGSLPQSPTF